MTVNPISPVIGEGVYRQFTNIADANAYGALCMQAMGYSADTPLQAFFIPYPLTDGTFVVGAYMDANAEPWQSTWTIQPPS